MSTDVCKDVGVCGAQDHVWTANIAEELTLFTTHPAGNGDGKYGAKDNSPRVALLSARLSFPHPQSGKMMDFSIDKPSGFPWDLFE